MLETTRVMVACTGIAVAGLVWSAEAELPGALDHIPPEAPVVAVIPNVAELLNDVNKFNNTFREALPPDLQQSLAMVGFAQLMLTQPGFDPTGSAAVAVFPPEEADAGEMLGADGIGGLMSGLAGTGLVAVLPINDFEAFRASPIAQGGVMEDGVMALDLMGQATVYMRDLEGFVALGMDRGQVTEFDGRAGRLEAHAARLGWAGSGVAGSNDLTVLAHIPALREGIEAQIAELDQQARMVAVMGGPQAAQGVELIETMVRNFARDADTGLIGLDLSDAGVGFDLSANFREGTELAGIFEDGGDSGRLLGKLPEMEFLVAGAFDMNAGSVGTLMRNYAEMAAEGGDEGLGFIQNLGFGGDLLDKQGGGAVVLGTSPAMGMAGVLSNYVAYTESEDPDAYVAAFEEVLSKADGLAGGGMKFGTSWERDVELEDHGITVDAYSVRVESDPESAPMGAMAMDPAMAMSMLYGMTGGPNGYIATTDTGAYFTVSKNGALLKKAIQSGEDGVSFASIEGVRNVSGRMLEEGRVGELYVSLNGIVDMAAPFAAMAGPEVARLVNDVPEFEPVGFSAASGGGGMTARVFVPGDVIGFMTEIGQAFEEQFGGAIAEPEPDEAPSF